MIDRPAARASSASPHPAGAALRIDDGVAAARMRASRLMRIGGRTRVCALPAPARRHDCAQPRCGLRPLRSPLRRPP